MTSGEKILSEIISDVKEQAAKITARAEAEIKADIADKKLEGEKSAEKILREAENKARVIKDAGAAAAERIARDSLLSLKRELIESAIEAAAETAAGYDDEKYFSCLLKLIAKNRLDKSGEVHISARDLSRDTSGFRERLREYSLDLSSTPADIDGGFILSYGDILINCAFSALIREKRDELTAALNKRLFV